MKLLNEILGTKYPIIQGGMANIATGEFAAACSGFLYATAVARGLLTTMGGQYGLVIGCEALSRLMDPADRSTCVLFGDGAGAAVYRLGAETTPFALTLGARGNAAIHAGGPSRTGSAPISMDGRAVFRFAVEALPRCLHTVLEDTGMTLEDLAWVVCHQANSRIIDHCVRALHALPYGCDYADFEGR